MKSQKLLSYVRQAVDDYKLIEEGDHIAVGVSGGKDSLTLLYAMKKLQTFYPKHFTLVAVTVDLGYPDVSYAPVAEFCHELDVPYEIISTEIASVLFQKMAQKRLTALPALFVPSCEREHLMTQFSPWDATKWHMHITRMT